MGPKSLSSPADSNTTSPAIALVGPTAIGKTAVAIELAKLLSGRAEILSIDSVQVYRLLDIGSAKPSAAERAQTRFHLIDLVDAAEPFTLADYQAAAVQASGAVAERGNVRLLVGGTGLYFRSLTQPLGLPEVPPDESLRAALFDEEKLQGPGTLHRRLRQLDESAAAKVHPNDAKRIVRALEVIQHTRSKISDLHRRDATVGEALIPCVQYFALNCDRATLYRRIEERVNHMMSDGFLEEVESLRKKGYSPALRSMKALGYSELNGYLDGLSDFTSAVAMIKQRTRQFARRQLIWFRADTRLTWLDAPPELSAKQIAETIFRLINF